MKQNNRSSFERGKGYPPHSPNRVDHVKKGKEPARKHENRSQDLVPHSNKALARSAQMQNLIEAIHSASTAFSTRRIAPPTSLEGVPGYLQQVGREADAAWEGVQRLVKVLNVETKTSFGFATVQPLNTGTLVLNISGAITQGVGDAQRTGDSIKLQKLRVKCFSQFNSDTSPMSLVLVHSKDGVPAASDVFETIASGSYSGFSEQNHDQRAVDVWKFRKTWFLDTYHPRGYFEFEIDLKSHVFFNAGAVTVTSGAITLWAISNVGTVNNTINIVSSLDYVDN